MAVDTNKKVSKEQTKNYLAKDFQSFKGDLVRYARNYFVEQNSDFSEASLGGMFVELAAYIGDSMSFYLDNQFNELDPRTAVQARNVVNHARNAGVRPTGAAPASVVLKIFIEVPATANTDGTFTPAESALPIVREGTSARSTEGVDFSTTEDLNFAERDVFGNLLAASIVSARDASGNPLSFILSREILAVSGKVSTITISVGVPRPFRKIVISEPNVSEIISVVDTQNNEYYEVDFLTQNTVFKKSKNLSLDQLEVPSILEIVPAGRRYTKDVNFLTATTTLTFGGGDESQPDDDLIPDPSELALPLFGKKTFTRFAIDPKNLMRTQTLGIAPANTTLKITFRHGGGSNHNVSAQSINTLENIIADFPMQPDAVVSANVIASFDVTNDKPAGGAGPKPSLDQLRETIFSSRNEQSRIVSQDDVLARLYTLPSTFGRVYRASLRKSSRNPLASEMFVLSQNKFGELVVAPDSLKKNLSTYLNEFRLISDAIDVLDTTIVNYGVEFSVVAAPSTNKQQLVSAITRELLTIVDRKFYQIDQPLIEADFINVIINTPGVLSLTGFTIFNRSGTVSSRNYSNFSYDLEQNKFKGMIVGPPGSIFEMKFPTSDILGSAE